MKSKTYAVAIANFEAKSNHQFTCAAEDKCDAIMKCLEALCMDVIKQPGRVLLSMEDFQFSKSGKFSELIGSLQGQGVFVTEPLEIN